MDVVTDAVDALDMKATEVVGMEYAMEDTDAAEAEPRLLWLPITILLTNATRFKTSRRRRSASCVLNINRSGTIWISHSNPDRMDRTRTTIILITTGEQCTRNTVN